MTTDQIIVFAILGLSLVFFMWGRWRYDVVAFTALIVAVVAGIVPTDAAFAGFGHPAVITVAAVLVISGFLAPLISLLWLATQPAPPRRPQPPGRLATMWVAEIQAPERS